MYFKDQNKYRMYIIYSNNNFNINLHYNILTEDDINVLIKYCNNKWLDSNTLGGKILAIRNSKQCWCDNNDVSYKLKSIASLIFNKQIENCESVQIVKYKSNNYYNEHFDSCCDNSKTCDDFNKHGGNRIGTLLVYLTDDFQGGETYFPNIGAKIKLKPGCGI